MTCSWEGCESYAEPNAADVENGPRESDLEPTYCVYHNEEGELVWLIDQTVRSDLGMMPWE